MLVGVGASARPQRSQATRAARSSRPPRVIIVRGRLPFARRSVHPRRDAAAVRLRRRGRVPQQCSPPLPVLRQAELLQRITQHVDDLRRVRITDCRRGTLGVFRAGIRPRLQVGERLWVRSCGVIVASRRLVMFCSRPHTWIAGVLVNQAQ